MAKKEVVPKPDMSVKEKENDGGIGGGIVKKVNL